MKIHILNMFKKKKAFSAECKCFEFIGKNGENSKIWIRKPTGDEILSFSYASLDIEKSDLKNISGEKNNAELLHRETRKNKFIPYAKKIITKISGYIDENGKCTDSIDFVEKYFPHHLETVAIRGYEVNDSLKKN